MKTLNKKTGKARIELTRIEICDLKLACTHAYQISQANKWANLHNKLTVLLNEYDEELAQVK